MFTFCWSGPYSLYLKCFVECSLEKHNSIIGVFSQIDPAILNGPFL